MRVLDCDRCGETLQAANDDELARGVRVHFKEEHGEELSEEEAEELLADEAYDAMDA